MTAANGSDCAPESAVAKLLAKQGDVRKGAGERAVQGVELGELLCVGERIETGPASRATLVLITNDVVVTMGEGTEILIRRPPEEQKSFLTMLKGLIHAFARKPSRIDVDTPFVTAAVKGTEFQISVRSQESSLHVFEGVVEFGGVDVASGQAVSKGANRNSEPRLVSEDERRAAVQWLTYYPRIVDARLGGAHPRLDEAVSWLDGGLPGPALNALTDRTGMNPEHIETARALESLVASVDGRFERAAELATPNAPGATRTVASVLAMSFAVQGLGRLEEARDLARTALKGHADSCLLWSRLAELELSLGNVSASAQAAARAGEADADCAEAHLMSGLIALAERHSENARTSFGRALQLQSSNPMAHLGMGLVLVRAGDIVGGRQEIEVAAQLQPGTALFRSYLGRAFLEEGRRTLAVSQFSTAIGLDGADPTPWMFRALAKQEANEPVAALGDFGAAVARSGNRAIYRAAPLLKEDLAVRGARLARLHRDLGFEERSLVEGRVAVTGDPTSAAAHRLLADTFASSPNQIAARDSELLQAELLQSANSNPVQPHLPSGITTALDDSAPASIGINEYGRAFERDGPRLIANGIVGTNATFADNVILSGLHDNLAYSFGHYHFQSDGLRQNDDLSRDSANAFVQVDVTPDVSVLGEIRTTHDDEGFRQKIFDPSDFITDLRTKVDRTSYRVGGRVRESSELLSIAAYTYESTDERLLMPGLYCELSDPERLCRDGRRGGVHLGEFRQFAGRADLYGTFGVGVSRSDVTAGVADELGDLAPAPADNFINAYAYGYFKPVPNVTGVMGFGVDSFDLSDSAQVGTRVTPRLGVFWQPWVDTNFRAAMFGGTRRPLVGSQTLEPTNVAGFEQFTDGVNGSTSWHYGVGVDQRLTDVSFVGGEVTYRTETQRVGGDARIPMTEMRTSVYANWAPHASLAVRTAAEWLAADRDSKGGNLGNFASTELVRIPLQFRWFTGRYAFWTLRGTYVNQVGRFIGAAEDSIKNTQRSEFFLVDAGAGARLPRGKGSVQLQISNLGNKRFRYQDPNGLEPEFSPTRAIVARVTLVY